MKIRFNQPENRIPNNDRGLRVRYSEAKRPGKPWRWYLILLISSLPLIYLIGLVIWEYASIDVNGRVRVTSFVVRAPVEGYVEQLFVEAQQTVADGVKLAQMTNATLQHSYDRLRLEIDALEKEKHKVASQVIQSQAAAGQLVQFAQEQKRFAHGRLHQYEALFEQNAATQAEVATARSQYKAALEHLAILERAREQELERMLSQEQFVSVEVRRIVNQINQMRLEAEKIDAQLHGLNLIAPEEGGLVTEIFVQPGEFLSRGQALLELIFPEKAFVDAFIPPKYQNYAEVGQSVIVKFPNGEKVKGKVTAVPGVMQKSPSEDANPLEVVRTAILARVAFTETVASRLMNGMPVVIYFD